MTTPRPIRETPHTPTPDIEPAARASQPVPDPWGVKRAENLIAGLELGLLVRDLGRAAADEGDDARALRQPERTDALALGIRGLVDRQLDDLEVFLAQLEHSDQAVVRHFVLDQPHDRAGRRHRR